MTSTAYDTLPDAVTEVFGVEATAEHAYDLLTVDVPTGSWIAALEIARDKLGCTYFDWLSAVDEPGTGFRVCAHVVGLEGRRVRRLMLRTTVPHTAPALPTAVDVYAGAAWHERETHEMFGVVFTDHPNLVPLLLPENFEGHPLRKDFVLAARVAKAWPGAKEPGEPAAGAAHGAPKRRQMLPPGVPDPNEWGPLKGQLPPAPARPARAARAGAGAGAGAAGAAGAAGERPARRTRSVSEGSASQAPAAPVEGAAAAEAPVRPPRRTRSASDGSASQAPAAPETPAGGAAAAEAPARPPRRTRSASDGSASQAGAPVRRSRGAGEGSASQRDTPPAPEGAAPARPAPTGSADAPWHNPRPAFDEESPAPAQAQAQAQAQAPAQEPADPEPRTGSGPDSGSDSDSDSDTPAGGDSA
ncbi:NADH-quinone oxidoreductase subunit C [Streptomyces sp. NPDC050504]|uniref:NADH-quinone oxidoreductase subunit C n=1 Tax=Streptomyces sp. NPDC050504 TaxID=3365618 RepID=UPI003796EB46